MPKGIFKKIRNKFAEVGLIDRNRKRIIKDFNELKPFINCEIASLHFSDYDILKDPVIQSADILHLHWIAGVIDYPTFFKTCSKPIIWTFHDTSPLLGLYHYKQDEVINAGISRELDLQVKKIKQDSYKKIKENLKIVTPSKWLADEVEKSKIFHPESTSMIANSIDTEVFYTSSKISFRREFGIPDDAHVLIFAAHLIEVRRKGFEILKEALSAVRNKFTLIAIGDVNAKYEFKQPIIFTGRVTNDDLLRSYYNCADAFILPSLEDNLPNVMLEAFACGIPVISFPLGGMKEHIIPFKTGLLAKSVSSESLKEIIEEFILHKDVFDAKLIKGYAITHFNPALQVEAYSSIYKQMI